MGALFLLLFLLFCIGIVYPIAGVIYYKVAKKSKKSIKEIINEL